MRCELIWLAGAAIAIGKRIRDSGQINGAIRIAWFMLLVISSLATFSPAKAADISCLRKFRPINYGYTFAEYREMWPSGFRPRDEDCDQALLRGEIREGDFEKVRTFLRAHQRTLSILYLHSPGGVVGEALQIGALLRKYLIFAQSSQMTQKGPWLRKSNEMDEETLCLGSDCVCASSCALIWFGAPFREGNVGLHRPFFSDPKYRALAPAVAAEYYQRLIKEIERYGVGMDIPRAIIDIMLATSSGDIQLVGTQTDLKLVWAPSIGGWVDATCGRITDAEREVMRQLSYKEAINTPLGSSEKRSLSALTEKYRLHVRCWDFLRSRAVDALPAP